MKKVPLRQQISAVQLELDQRKTSSPRKMTRSEIEFHAPKLAAAIATLQWLEQNEPAIRGAVAK